METRRIGSLEVSLVGLGCNNFGWRIDAGASAAAVSAALEAGINFFDTADIYGAGASEEFLGRALGPRRGEVDVYKRQGHHTMAGNRGGRGRAAGHDSPRNRDERAAAPCLLYTSRCV